MEKIKDEKLRKILQEMAEPLRGVYGNLLKVFSIIDVNFVYRLAFKECNS